MMAAYIVFMRDLMRDTKEFGTYMEAVPPTLAGHPVKPLALYGAIETLEGPPIEGAVIVEFPTLEAGMRVLPTRRRYNTVTRRATTACS
jgi:uncharacterized protein (DUF1330 family)